MNTSLANALEQIAIYYSLSSDTYRSKTYDRASTSIRNYADPISSGYQASASIRGIGSSISQDIDEYLTTGTITRLQNLQQQHADKKAVLDLFTSLYGIGPVTALKFYQSGYRTVEDLWNYAPLTDAQIIGIQYRFHIEQPIPRSEMVNIEQVLQVYLSDYTWDIAGSYRRGEPRSGDIDLLIAQTPGLTLEEIVDRLQPLLVATLAQGPTKYMGMLRLSDQCNAHRLDIRLINQDYYPYALMYFTGSQRFNILMRQRAIDLGLRLNEYSLHDDSTFYPATTEADIFQHLGVKYLAPTERIRDLNALTLI